MTSEPQDAHEERATEAPLDSVREELRRMGYLSHRVERYLLQDAVRSVEWRGTVLRLAAKLGGLGGAAMAFVSVLLLLHWNPSLRSEPFDLLPLFLHLLPLWVVTLGIFFLLLAGILAMTLRRYPGLRINHVSLNLAVAGVVLGFGIVLWGARRQSIDLSGWPSWLVAAAAALVAYLMAVLLHNGLLALAIRLTHRTPREPAGRRGVLLLLAAATASLVLVPASLLPKGTPEAPSVLPQGAGGRVLLIGIDGVLAEELDYLLARRELPGWQELLETGAVLAGYQRPLVDPAALWTSVATGLSSPQHGVLAIDSFRPLGLRTALGVSGPFRPYWNRIERPLGLAEHRPVLANRRRADAFWELAARGGDPVLAINWWSTYPAREIAGVVVAHGGYQLLTEGAPGAVAPVTAGERLISRWRPEARRRGSQEIVRSALGPAADALIERAILPEQFYRDALRSELSATTRAAALYLPALDLAASDWAGGDVPFADLVREELRAADALLVEALARGDWDTVAVVADPGRRGPDSAGRVLLWRSVGCASSQPRASIEVEQVASALLRGLGLPQSRELPDPPALCRWQSPPVTVETFGRRQAITPAENVGEEYLDSLRALGYL